MLNSTHGNKFLFIFLKIGNIKTINITHEYIHPINSCIVFGKMIFLKLVYIQINKKNTVDIIGIIGNLDTKR